jgi:hypothetical protein
MFMDIRMNRVEDDVISIRRFILTRNPKRLMILLSLSIRGDFCLTIFDCLRHSDILASSREKIE